MHYIYKDITTKNKIKTYKIMVKFEGIEARPTIGCFKIGCHHAVYKN